MRQLSRVIPGLADETVTLERRDSSAVIRLLDDYHGEDPGVDKVLHAVGDRVDRVSLGRARVLLPLVQRQQGDSTLRDHQLDKREHRVGRQGLRGRDHVIDGLPRVFNAPEASGIVGAEVSHLQRARL